ncbi:MAG TPA: amidohydrolase family protein [Halothiobacillus sp.]|jgi:cytosine/adenosine deaminase-related metal-dependent hydrolase|nr:amidohydrolase family protein [Halothiobacillus sp.]
MSERLLIREAEVVITMNAQREEIAQGSVLIEGDTILKVGTATELDLWITEDLAARQPHRTINASGCVVMPGLVNCHHHLYQTLTRAIGTGRGYALFDWLKLLYPVWAEMDPEAIHVSTQVGLAELMLSGATTVADHLYLSPYVRIVVAPNF